MTTPVTAGPPASAATASRGIGPDAGSGDGAAPFASALDGALAEGHRAPVGEDGAPSDQGEPADGSATETETAAAAVPAGGPVVFPVLWALAASGETAAEGTPVDGAALASGAPVAAGHTLVVGTAPGLAVASARAGGIAAGLAAAAAAAGRQHGPATGTAAEGSAVPGASATAAGTVAPGAGPAAATGLPAGATVVSSGPVPSAPLPMTVTSGPVDAATGTLPGAALAAAVAAGPAAATATATGAESTGSPTLPGTDATAVTTLSPAAAGTGTDIDPHGGDAPGGTGTEPGTSSVGATAAPTSAAPVAKADGATGPTAAQPVAAQLARQVAVLRGGPDGAHSMTIVLTPDTLGPVEVSVTLSQGTVELTLRGASEHGRAALLDAVPDLRRDLEAAGLTCSRVDVDRDARDGSWSAQQQSSSDRWAGGQGRQHDRSDSSARPWLRSADNGEGRPAPTASRSALSGVDVRV